MIIYYTNTTRPPIRIFMLPGQERLLSLGGFTHEAARMVVWSYVIDRVSEARAQLIDDRGILFLDYLLSHHHHQLLLR